jgi:hypothetical protein
MATSNAATNYLERTVVALHLQEQLAEFLFAG